MAMHRELINIFEHVCGYELGIYYEIDRKCSSIYVEYYTKGKILKSYTLKIC